MTQQQPWLATLDAEQIAAATCPAGTLRILAGAGTGKTTTLVARVAHEVLVNDVDPARLMVLTFTRRAAHQLVRRTRRLLEESGVSRSSASITAGTFHSVANHWLRATIADGGPGPNFSVLDRSDASDLMGVTRAEHFSSGAPTKRFPRADALLNLYSTAINKQHALSQTIDECTPWANEHSSDIVEICQHYLQRKRQQRLLDFDDLLLYWNSALANSAEKRFDHIFVDEYQDVNALQVQIVRELTSSGARLTVVGDDAQAIYGFRGASPEFMLNFHADFPDSHTLPLSYNYRSPAAILAIPNAISADAPVGFSTQLQPTVTTDSPRPRLILSYDDDDQASAVCESVLAELEDGRRLVEQAVLMRAASHSSLLELELARRKIPFVKYGGLRYLETAHVKDCIAAFRLAENPRDEIAWFRVLQLIDGVGRASVNRFLDIVRSDLPPDSDDISAAIPSLINCLPSKAQQPGRELLTSLMRWPSEGVDSWAARIVTAVSPHIVDKYSDGPARLSDLDVLVSAAHGAVSLASLAADHTIDEPSKTSGLAGPPVIDDDYLVLSTIHSAKGLEWDCVHVLNVTDGCLPLDMSLRDADGLEEERRLLYVAVTRARSQLTLHAPIRFHVDKHAPTERHVWGQPSRFLTERVCAGLETQHRRPTERESNPTPDLRELESTVDANLAALLR